MNDLTEFDLLVRGHADSIIGAIVCDPSCTVEIAKVLQPSDFVGKVEREVFRLVHELHKQTPGFGVDAIVSEMRKRKLYSADYNIAWLGSLASRAVVNQAIAYDSHELLRLSKLRKIQRIAAESTSPKADPDLLLSELMDSQTLTGDASALSPISVADLHAGYPDMREPVVCGILRRGETCNIIAPPKVGKSFLAGNLAWSVATGTSWLSHDVLKGRVLILDNELHPETLASRLTHIADEMGVSLDDRSEVDVISLRGRLTPIDALEFTTNIEPGAYNLVVLDALYRTLPQGCSENDNAAMMAVNNHLDKLADKWQSAIVVVHHSSKGAQGDKAVTDMGAGAGAISRAADCHIAIRQHETDGHFVLEAVTRSFKSPEPVSIAFEWPVWVATTLTPEVKRQGRKNEAAQAKSDEEACIQILAKIPDGKLIQQNKLFEQFDFGESKSRRLAGKLISAGKVKIVRRKRKGYSKPSVFYAKVTPEVTLEVTPEIWTGVR